MSNNFFGKSVFSKESAKNCLGGAQVNQLLDHPVYYIYFCFGQKIRGTSTNLRKIFEKFLTKL